MDAISYSYADKQAKRIKNVIADPDSTSGVLTVPKTIASGENITIPSGRVAVLPNVQIDGTLNVQGDVFIPSGATLSGVVEKVASTDNAVVRFDGTTGKVQNSGVIIDDNGNVNMNGSIANTFTAYGVSGANKGYVGDGYWLFAGSVNDFGIRATNNLVLGTGTTERMRIDSAGNVGIGVIPNIITAGYKTLQINGSAGVSLMSSSNDSHLSTNAYYNGGYLYQTTGVQATDYVQAGGIHYWKTAPSGTAGNTITWTNAMTLDASGNLTLNSGTGVLGYGTGAGGTVTQLTSKSTSVTLNKPTGTIITNGSALAAGATVDFSFFNSVYTNSYDIINLQLLNTVNANNYNIWATNNGPGFAFKIFIKNISASSLSDVLTINFSLTKGAIS